MFKIALILFAFALPLLAKPTRFEVKDMGARNLFMLISDALLEKSVAMTHFIDGWIELDPERITEIKGEFEIDVRTLDHGVELKNIQLREQFLNASEFPISTVSIATDVSKLNLKLIDQKAISLKVDAMVKLKNISKSVPVNVKLVWFKEGELTRQRGTGNLLKISTSSEIELSNFGIIVPGNFNGLVANKVLASSELLGSDRLPSALLPVPEGIKKK